MEPNLGGRLLPPPARSLKQCADRVVIIITMILITVAAASSTGGKYPEAEDRSPFECAPEVPPGLLFGERAREGRIPSGLEPALLASSATCWPSLKFRMRLAAFVWALQ